eukprot:4531451-Prymnesium_polylepis.1
MWRPESGSGDDAQVWFGRMHANVLWLRPSHRHCRQPEGVAPSVGPFLECVEGPPFRPLGS